MGYSVLLARTEPLETWKTGMGVHLLVMHCHAATIYAAFSLYGLFPGYTSFPNL